MKGLFGYIIHVNFLPTEVAILAHVNTKKIVTSLRTVSLTHGIKSDVVDMVICALVPFMHMTAKDYAGMPFFELVEEKIRFFARESRGELHQSGSEDVGVTENESMTISLIPIEDTLFNKVNLCFAKCSAGRVKENKVVINPFTFTVNSDLNVKLIER